MNSSNSENGLGRAKPTEALLVLSDGTTFEGEAIGYHPENGISTGEVVFNTILSGYQEVITDPSYAGQIITFTYPHIGNYGTNDGDDEGLPVCRGIVVRELARRHSNWRADSDLGSFMSKHRVPGISGIDTRRLTRLIRDVGALNGAFGTAGFDALLAAAKTEKGTAGVDLVNQVSTQSVYRVGEGPLRVVAYDFGIKRSIVKYLAHITGSTVTVVPAVTSAEEVLGYDPHGVFLSNGPGDPEVCQGPIEQIRILLDTTPIFGICLGHQLMATALGGTTFKLPFGHHGGNHPVRHVESGRVEITSQNHNFAVLPGSVASADVTHVNLNDGVIEGLKCREIPAFSVQHHPEASPGPHESQYLFEDFRNLMLKVNKPASVSPTPINTTQISTSPISTGVVI